MEWFQIVVLYAHDHTSLFVDKDMCQIDGGRRISEDYLEEWDGDISKLSTDTCSIGETFIASAVALGLFRSRLPTSSTSPSESHARL